MKLIFSGNNVKSLCFTHAVKRIMAGEVVKASLEEIGMHNNGGSCVDCFMKNLEACGHEYAKTKKINNVVKQKCFLCKKPTTNFMRTVYEKDNKVHDFCNPCYTKLKVATKDEKNNIEEDTLRYFKNLQLKEKGKEIEIK